MQYFMCKLIPPFKTFPHDMSERESDLMRQHAEYCPNAENRALLCLSSSP